MDAKIAPFWGSVCLGIALLAPSLAQAAVLDIPGDGDKLSGIGVISGWKCEAEGDITIRFNDGDPIPATYGFPRGDTSATCGDDDGNNGFYSFFNWALLGDGQHTAVAYDNGKQFARSTFEVTTLGEEFVKNANARLRVPNFPSPGEEAWFEWNQATQHLELRESTQMAFDEICVWLEAPPTPVPQQPLLRPPPLPCPPGDSFDGKYFIQFAPPRYALPPDSSVVCEAPRGTMQVRIEGGRMSGSTRAPPLGRVEVSGEVCHKNGLFVGEWTLDGRYQGYVTGSLADPDGINCQSRWHDTVGCTGDFNTFELPRQ